MYVDAIYTSKWYVRNFCQNIEYRIRIEVG